MSRTSLSAEMEANYQAGIAASVVKQRIIHHFKLANRTDICHRLAGPRAGNQPWQVHP